MSSIIKRVRSNRVLVRGIKIFIFAGISAVITYLLNQLPNVDMSPEIYTFLNVSLTALQAMINKSYRLGKAS